MILRLLASFMAMTMATALDMERELSSSSSSSSSSFTPIDPTAYYSGMQQAWRMLGFFVDCNYAYASQSNNNEQHRELPGGDQTRTTCQRYLLWAAYIDPNYQGGGLGEYSLYDQYTSSYTNATCEATGSSRCVPMDCHESSSQNWQLLGVYKEAFYAQQWMEQLFKHAGYCLWDESTYEFMQDYRESWPESCTSTGLQSASGIPLYLDLKPATYGNMAFGLYTDSICKTEYTGSSYNAATVASQLGYLSGNYLTAWNKAMNQYKQCQPCIATDTRSYRSSSSSSSSGYSNRYSKNNGGRELGDDENNGYFTCNDDAGYTNVNQCMKFRSHTYLEVATGADLEAATNQGGINPIKVQGRTYGIQRQVSAAEIAAFESQQSAAYTPRSSAPMLAAGIIVLLLGVAALALAITSIVRRRNQKQRPSLREPLV